MQKVLSLLLAFVFLEAQSFALSGGPVFNSGSQSVATIGTYAGVLIPTTTNRLFDNPNAPQVPPGSDSNALGIFVLGVPDTGVATGNYLFFQEGEAFFGTMTGVVDPATGLLRGLIAGAAATNNIAGTGVEFFSPVSAVGKIEAEVIGASGVSAFGGTRVAGEAFIQLQGFVPDNSPNGAGFATVREITFDVDGFKQSDAASTPAIPPPNTVDVQPPGTTTTTTTTTP